MKGSDMLVEDGKIYGPSVEARDVSVEPKDMNASILQYNQL